MHFSAAFFCPRTRAPSEECLISLRAFLRAHSQGNLLLSHVAGLQQAWQLFAESREDIRALPNGDTDVSVLVDWATGGSTTRVCEANSGIVALPLLLVLQIAQYLHLLDSYGISHVTFLESINIGGGGLHGYCGGAGAALSIACAKDEGQVIANAAVFLRLLLGLGAIMEAAETGTIRGSTTLALRLKNENQGKELTERFQGTYISAITEPKSISIVGPAETLTHLCKYAKEMGLPVHEMDITGKGHNPENMTTALELLSLCRRTPMLQLPGTTSLQTVVRSNVTGDKLSNEDVLEDTIKMILASRCDWHGLLAQVAEDLEPSTVTSHPVAVFGLDDCVPLSPFHSRHRRISKVQGRIPTQPVESIQLPNHISFPEGAIAIIGASCRFPGANNLEELWELVSQGSDRHQEVPHARFDTGNVYRELHGTTSAAPRKLFGNFLDDIQSFDRRFFSINPKEAPNIDPQQRLLLELSYEALESSGYLATHVRDTGDRVGCFIGASMVEYLDNTNAYPSSAYTSTGTLRGFLCGRLSYYYGWTGPSEVIDTACSSSLVAIHRACKALQTGECKMAIAGGVNAITGINNFLDLNKAGFLSPTGQCKPFDSSADGYCRSEGAGLVVLKPLSHARTDNDQILGIIPSISTSQGGLSSSLTVPSSTALQSLYKKVLQTAGLTASQITYVETHGTGTQAGDPIEMESIRTVLGTPTRQGYLSVGSLKGNIGHAETAAGVAGLLKVLAMLKHGQIPPQANFHSLNPKIPPLEPNGLQINQELTPWAESFRAAVVNSYGAAGSNCALICCEDPATKSNLLDRNSTCVPQLRFPIILSASSKNSLVSYARSLAAFLSREQTLLNLEDLAFTLDRRRKRLRFCLDTHASDVQTVVEFLNSAQAPTFEYPERAAPVVLVFGGQHDNKVALSRGLYDNYERFRFYVDKCNARVMDLGHRALYSSIFQSEPITDVVSLQCGIFAVQYACAQCWIDAGLKVDAVVGHSFGELVALAVSGILSLEDAIKLVATRAHLIDKDWGLDKGAMLAIFSTEERVKDLISHLCSREQSQEDLVEIACYNAPHGLVVAGSTQAIQAAENTLSSHPRFADIKFRRLSTTHAFHSYLTESILSQYATVADRLTWNAPKLTFETCTAEEPPPLFQWSAVGHTRNPVYFDRAVRRVEQRLGPCVWLEAGLNSPIMAMCKRASTSPERHTFLSMDTKLQQEPSNIIGNVVSKLWRHGISLTHWAYLGGHVPAQRQIWLPPYQFDRNPYWLDHVDRAMEVYQQLSQQANSFQAPESLASNRLVYLEQAANTNVKGIRYTVNHLCQRFRDIVEGHRVLGHPLCPASLYMECVVMAVQLNLGDAVSQGLEFERLEFLAPLGDEPSHKVFINLEKVGYQALWTFTVQSQLAGAAHRHVLHCRGRVCVSEVSEFGSFIRLLDGNIGRVTNSKETERLLAQRAYALFSGVVNYNHFLKGISTISLNGNEAVAQIALPDQQPRREDSTVWDHCDSVLIDSFISVAGLLINTSDIVPHDCVMVAVAVDSATISSKCKSQNGTLWQVYAKFTVDQADQHEADVFVYGLKGEMVAMFIGIRFSKVERKKLEISLCSANVKPDLNSQTSCVSASSPAASSLSGVILTPASDSNGTALGPVTSQTDMLKKLLSSYTGLDTAEISSTATFVNLGIDSLSSIELSAEIQSHYGISVDPQELGDMTLAAFQSLYNAAPKDNDPSSFLSIASAVNNSFLQQTGNSAEEENNQPRTSPHSSVSLGSPFHALAQAESQFEAFAKESRFQGYWRDVFPPQNSLQVAYILEALKELKVDVLAVAKGHAIPQFAYPPRYAKFMSKVWEVLEKQGIVEVQHTKIIRSHKDVFWKASNELHQSFISEFPEYAPEADLMKLTGPKLAQCLRGTTEPVSLMFGNPEVSKVMERYYHTSPMLSTATKMLVSFIKALLRSAEITHANPLRILEVGAGTGGTTARLVEALISSAVPCRYCFTDISPALVSKAREKFRKYSWMDFATLDLEKDVKGSLKDQFHIVFSTNCVHATRDRVISCRRLKNTLTDGGVLVLSEVTRPVDWFDMCFGLLDGWWYAGNGTEYPLQPAYVWMKAFRDAGFEDAWASKGESDESMTQQLLVASNGTWPESDADVISKVIFSNLGTIEELVYKEVDGVQLIADIYLPKSPRANPMPIALMLHGGGHVSLSRKHIRPAQTDYLLQSGFLPISIDYRLCPEVRLRNGPMADVLDAYNWARSILPSKLAERGVCVNSERIVAIGWSTGGHLAMSLAWTTKEAGLPAPAAILSFYAPVDFASGELDAMPRPSLPEPILSIEEILRALPRTPIPNYVPSDASDMSFSWLCRGAPRADLLLHIFKHGVGLRMLLHGLPAFSSLSPSSPSPASPSPSSFSLPAPSPNLITQICPTSQLRLGTYTTPTFIIHGTHDNIAPIGAARAFIRELRERGVKAGVLDADGKGHGFDGNLRPGMENWERWVRPGLEFLVRGGRGGSGGDRGK